MKTCTVGVSAEFGESRLPAPVFTLASRPALLRWINAHELEELRETLAHGNLPADFLWKLKHLAGGDLNHRFIERNCRQFAALLLATEAGEFRDLSPAERERLLRVLAYVRKEDDARPDSAPEGLTDDQQEVRAVLVELGGLLTAFKAWRLRHQVPGMWSEANARMED